jgi:ribosomal protein L11 methyltransferase
MHELRLLCPEDRVEAVSEALDLLDALSVSVEDADAQTDAEQALFGEPGMPPPKEGWQRSRVLALFANEAAAQEASRLLQAQDFFTGCKLLGIVPVPDQDWVRLTQSQFAPVEITPEFWIVPTWHEPPAQARQVIRLDPGLAFGTGTHPTTRMCLRWIAEHPPPGRHRSTRSISIRLRCNPPWPTRKPTASSSKRACPIG